MEVDAITSKKRLLYDDGNDGSGHSRRSHGNQRVAIASPIAKRVLLMNDDNENANTNNQHHHHDHKDRSSDKPGGIHPETNLHSPPSPSSSTIPETKQHQRRPHTYQVRSLTALYRDNRRTNDEIHSSISLGPVVTCILDTPPMQRLRGLKQLGCAEYVYINVNHNRFEHSLGVATLAETLCRKIRIQQPSLQCTEKDVLCVQLAGTYDNTLLIDPNDIGFSCSHEEDLL